MAAISNQWTGNGLANATAITSGNVATAGNTIGGGTWSRPGLGGTPTLVTAGDGMAIGSSVSTDIARLDYALASMTSGMVAQYKFTCPSDATGTNEEMVLRTGTTTGGGTATGVYVRFVGTTRVLELRDANNNTSFGASPALTAGDVVVVNVGAALNAVPDVGNGRIAFQVKNLTNGTWDTDGQWQYYSGVRNLTNNQFVGARFGKTGGDATFPTAKGFEFLGAAPASFASTDDTYAEMAAFFPDDPAIANAAPTASITANQNVTAGATATASVAAIDSDGSIASYAWSVVTAKSTSTPTLTGGTTASVSFTAPAAGNLVTLQCVVTDNLGATVTPTTEVRVPVSGATTARPLALNGTTVGSWTTAGGSSTHGAALADESDATYLESPALSGVETAMRVRWQPHGTRATANMKHRLWTDTGTATATVRLYEGSTLRQSWTQAITTTPTEYTFTLSAGTVSAIGDYGNLFAEVAG